MNNTIFNMVKLLTLLHMVKSHKPCLRFTGCQFGRRLNGWQHTYNCKKAEAVKDDSSFMTAFKSEATSQHHGRS